MNVAFYGGSFNPPHVAHVLAAAYVLSAGDFEKLIVVPVFDHAFDKQLAPFDDRVRMTELAMAVVGAVEVSRIEESLGSPSRTLFTLRALSQRHPTWRFRLVVGSDVLYEAQKWHAFEKIQELAPLFVLGRVGSPHPEAPEAILPAVSSTHVRELIARPDDALGRAELERLVPRAVLRYIEEHSLYR
jgi:nicotinate-nucleotide adenylyltransferase